MWVRSLGRENALEEEMATHKTILAWKIPLDKGTWWAIVFRVTTENKHTAQFLLDDLPLGS